MPDQDRLISAIDAEEETSYGSTSSGALGDDRAAAINAYLGANTYPAPEGRSQVVDRSVYETSQWVMPSLTGIFANGDDVVELPPLGPDDEPASKQEAAYLNYLVLQKNNWFQIFTTAAKDALLTKAGYLYAYREKRRQIELERYERQSAEGLAFILKDGAEVVSLREYADDQVQAQQPEQYRSRDPLTGDEAYTDGTTAPPAMVLDSEGRMQRRKDMLSAPREEPVFVPPTPEVGPDGMPAAPAMLYDIEIRRVQEEVSYCIDALPPERVKVSRQCRGVQVTDAPYFEYYDYCTISDLRQMGFEVKDDIGQNDDEDPVEESARDQFDDQDFHDDRALDPSMRRVRVRWIWIRHDYDEDGIAELQYVVRVGNTILHREEVNSIPVGVLCPDPLPHRHIGLSLADVTMEIQAIKTVLLRQGLDNLYLTNNARMFVNAGKVNLDDLIKNRPGGVVRGNNAVYGQDIMPIQTPFVFPQAVEGLGYMEQVAEGRTGVNKYFQGTDQNALNKTASGVQQLTTMASQRVQQIARSFSNGIETLFGALHAIVLQGGHKRDVVKLRGAWVEVDPSTWRKRQDFKISVGYASGNKDAMVSRLMLIAQFQEKAAAGGLPIVNPRNLYETAIELTKASDFSAPERFWTDPSTVAPPPPPQPDVTVMAAEQIRAQTELQATGAKMETDKATTAAQLEVEKYKADLEAQTRLTIERLKAEQTAEMERFKAQHSVGMKQFEGDQSIRMKQIDAELNPKMVEAKTQSNVADQIMESQKQQTQMLAELAKAIQKLGGPRRVIRGKDGRAEAVVSAE